MIVLGYLLLAVGLGALAMTLAIALVVAVVTSAGWIVRTLLASYRTTQRVAGSVSRRIKTVQAFLTAGQKAKPVGIATT